MNKKDELRAGVWLRAIAIPAALTLACLFGAINAAIIALIVLWVSGVICDIVYFHKKSEENKQKSDEHFAELLKKIDRNK